MAGSSGGSTSTLDGIAGGFTKSGAGTLVLSSASNTYTGGTTISGGTLRLDFSTNNNAKLGAATNVLTIGAGTLDLTGGSFAQGVASTSITGAASITRSSGSSTVNLAAINITPGTALNVGADSIATTNNLNVNNILPGILVGGFLAKNSTNAASGPIVALVPADYTNVNRLGGVIANGAATNVQIVNSGSSGPATPGSAVTTINTLTQAASDGPSTVDLQGNTLRLGPSGTILVPSGSGAMTFNNGTLTAGGADNTAGTITVNHVADVTVNSTIADNGSGAVGLIQIGNSTLNLLANNSYSGGTVVGSGTLQVGNGSTAGTLGSGSVTNNSAVVFNRGDVIIVGNSISGSGSVTQNGSGTLVLSGNNSYGGGTTIRPARCGRATPRGARWVPAMSRSARREPCRGAAS